MQVTNGAYRREAFGTMVALLGLAALLFLMLPFRAHLSIATPALVFVIPVVLGVVVGGFVPGALGAVAGFLLYDIFFIPPYGTVTVRAAQNWVALVVYAVVALVVARVVADLQSARQESFRREEDARRLFELSRALIGELTLPQLLEHIVVIVQALFAPRWTVLLLPDDEGAASESPPLSVAARAGQELTVEDLDWLTASGGQTRSLGFPGGDAPSRVAVALVASNHPVGLLVLEEAQFARPDRALLGTFANQAALAVERAQLQDQVLDNRLLEEVDRWRRAMLGAVSHDLRTPLASVKTAVSSLRQDSDSMQAGDRADLLELIELQSDRLARLVTNLLDMTRIESGALTLRSSLVAFDELVGEAIDAVTGLVPPNRIVVEDSPELPMLEIDHMLIGQVLANLLENSARLAPGESPIHIEARAVTGASGPMVEIAVADQGPGIATSERDRVFEMFSQHRGGGRAGIGLTIAKAFVEAHGGTIWIDPDVERGARVVFTVPSAATVPARV